MSLDERLAAVERALADGDVEPAVLSEAAAVERRLDDVERRQDDLDARLADLEAAVDALRGRLGEEDRDVRAAERTAERALATAREASDRLDADPPTAPVQPVVGDPGSDDTDHDAGPDDLLAWVRERW